MSNARGSTQTAVFSLGGELEAFQLPALSDRVDALIKNGKIRIVVNMRKLSFINSTAIGFLLKIQDRLRAMDGEMVFSEPSDALRKSLDTLGLAPLFKSFPEDYAAHAYFRDVAAD